LLSERRKNSEPEFTFDGKTNSKLKTRREKKRDRKADAHIADGCKRCNLKPAGFVCDVGVKAIYRAIRRCCRNQLESLGAACGGKNKDTNRQSVAAALNICSGDAEADGAVATLFLAFVNVKHKGAPAHQTSLEKGVQAVCYNWNREYHQ
jgi:hypothetical protein